MTGIMKQQYDTFTRKELLQHREEEAERYRKEKEEAKSK
jgi:hypothetical protein|tara:strand:- start:295 stop:411 length:117 start_codon:yes stop_codon:yes gene_type:complete